MTPYQIMTFLASTNYDIQSNHNIFVSTNNDIQSNHDNFTSTNHDIKPNHDISNPNKSWHVVI